MVLVLGNPCAYFADFGESKVDGVHGGRKFQGVPDDVVFVGVGGWADDFAFS